MNKTRKFKKKNKPKTDLADRSVAEGVVFAVVVAAVSRSRYAIG